MSNEPKIDPVPSNAPDPATVYERAKPKKESPSGKLGLPTPPKQEREDQHQMQNQEPRDPKASHTT